MERIWEIWPRSRFLVSSRIKEIWVLDGRQVVDMRVDQRWFMFQNMGPAPSVRSGHRMAAVGSRVFVLGGESSVSGPTDDPTIIQVLDTSTYFRACI